MAIWRGLLVPSISSNDSPLVDLTFSLTHCLVFIWSDMVFLEYPGIAARSFGNCLFLFLFSFIFYFLFVSCKATCTIRISSILVHNHNSNQLSTFRYLSFFKIKKLPSPLLENLFMPFPILFLL